jgi:hypothetical protein
MTGTALYLENSQAALCRELDRVYDALTGPGKTATVVHTSESENLERLVRTFGLSPFERDILLMCAGVELESRFATACGAEPTFSLAFAMLPGAHWSAINRDGPLRYWRLVEVAAGRLMRSALRLDQRILHSIAGLECEEERLQGLTQAIPPAKTPPSEAQCACALRVVTHWKDSAEPVLLLGRRHSERRSVTREIGRLLQRRCYSMLAADIPMEPGEREQLARLWNREAMLTGALLCVEAAEVEAHESTRLSAFLRRIETATMVETREGSAGEQVDGLRVRVPRLETPDRKALWIRSLGDDALRLNGDLDRVAEYFDLDGDAIQLAGQILRASGTAEGNAGQETWQTCRELSRRTLDGLARRVEPKATWADLILPPMQSAVLLQMTAHVRQRAVVYGQWGFGARYAQGLGVTALFAGSSGTGKTMAAEVIAHELHLDLYQIDLAGVVSKYIGETEKNLRRVFDAADDSGAVLLFDEADALFGKRSEVRDSHDRYANLEISYLLQRMEAYRGLAILTTNMKQALDPAFLRRMRFLVQFPFPGEAERRRIWERVFPSQAPVGRLDFARIAKLNVPGGLIRNIATHAAFLAADRTTEIEMEHVLAAARVEYAKLERPLTPAETGAWR